MKLIYNLEQKKKKKDKCPKGRFVKLFCFSFSKKSISEVFAQNGFPKLFIASDVQGNELLTKNKRKKSK